MNNFKEQLAKAFGFDTIDQDTFESVGSLLSLTSDELADCTIDGRSLCADREIAVFAHECELEDEQIEIFDADPDYAVQVGNVYLIAI